MSKGINKVILIGNLGVDPDARYLPSGNAVTAVRLATSETWKDKASGEQKEKTEWHRVVFFNKLAEIAAQYLKKGAKIYVEGKISTRKWQDKEGKDQYMTEIHANEMQMLDSKGNGQVPQTSHDEAKANGYKNEDERKKFNSPETYDWSKVVDDDIPF